DTDNYRYGEIPLWLRLEDSRFQEIFYGAIRELYGQQAIFFSKKIFILCIAKSNYPSRNSEGDNEVRNVFVDKGTRTYYGIFSDHNIFYYGCSYRYGTAFIQH